MRAKQLATDSTSSQPTTQGSGQPSGDQFRSADIVLIEVAKLQNDGEHIKSLLMEIRTDLRDVRDRTIKLEEAVRANDKTLEETRKKVDRVHNWVIGASAIIAFLVVASQILLRIWPATPQPSTPVSGVSTPGHTQGGQSR